ncbi:hypothetical protein B8W96_03595 [Lentilactobacillus parakefiri]|nr:hypothetical protein FD08_GL001754 [Lentilactobacillus parakefiri DSM 10551]PAL00997.1 hypothetical protein B8W96_03595 [Lentilactobacillus parakefiri]
MFADKSTLIQHLFPDYPHHSHFKIGALFMTVKLTQHESQTMLPIPDSIIPKSDRYTVFQTPDGAILFLPQDGSNKS